MNILVILIQLLFTIPLFCIIEYFNKKEISIIQKILIPVVYIVILAGLCSEIKSNIYLVVIFEVILHDFYINNIVNKDILINKKEYFINSVISIVLSIFIYDYFISKVDNILPVATEFRSLLWFLVILFVYGLLKDNISKVEKENKTSFIDRKREYVVVMYAKFKNKYYKIIKSKEEVVNRLTYAVMIYENYRNPILYRRFMNFKNKFVNRDTKYGIMQVESSREIDDEKSIKLTISKFEKSLTKIDKKSREKTIVVSLLNEKYEDSEYINDILDIYNEIIEFENR